MSPRIFLGYRGRHRARFQVLSPDGLPIEPKTYASETAARAALARWSQRFQAQGYYAGVTGRIPLEELLDRCEVTER